jgi:hypothetical protein
MINNEIDNNEINNNQTSNNQINNKSKRERKTKSFKRRTLHLVLLLGVTSTVFIVATYAWFIGITTVSVDSFKINIQTTPGIEISLDAASFSSSVNITEETITASNTSTNNHWVGDDGLTTYSSNGKLSTTGHLTFFSKASISASTGGFKLRTEQVDNSTTEQDGYVVFDIFLRNTTNANTSTVLTYSPDDEEGVYLTYNSKASMVATGGATGGDGIENTVRVGFYQIARAAFNADQSLLLSMNCSSNANTDNALGLCSLQSDNTYTSKIGDGRGWNWNIWEPNDKKHNTTSVNHFTKICRKRTSATAYSTENCTPITDNSYVTTYAVNDTITATNNVNIYDGLNDYTANSQGENSLLTVVGTYTDTDKSLEADQKSEIFYLAPNSVTKVRVYVWLEGQDVDNFDNGAIGKNLSITFGFTKDKYSDTSSNS